MKKLLCEQWLFCMFYVLKYTRMSTTPNWDEVFNRTETCSLCGETVFMCDCRHDDIPDHDSFDDEDHN